jgi:hypothetical protein
VEEQWAEGEEVGVWLQDLLSPLRDPSRLHPDRVPGLPAALRVLRVSWEADDAECVLRCGLWAAQLDLWLEAADQGAERRRLETACSLFALERLRMLRVLRALSPSLSLGGRAYSHYPAPVRGQDEEFPPPLPLRAPLAFRLQEELCSEPVFCGHTAAFQRRLRAWQFPEDAPQTLWPQWAPRTCASSRFLVFEPPSDMHGLGSLLEVTAAAFRRALCLGRILLLQPEPALQRRTFLKWRHPGCAANALECYFEPLSGCSLGLDEMKRAVALNLTSTDGAFFDRWPLREERVLLLRGLPSAGPCSLCNDRWPLDSPFFDGLFLSGVSALEGEGPRAVKEEGNHYIAFTAESKQLWIAQFLRFLMRPRPWLAQTLSQIVRLSMVSPAAPSPPAWEDFPNSFLSMHVRFGMKEVEVGQLQPLSRYMAVARGKLPHLSDVFLSTETQEVVEALVRWV